MGKIMVYSQQQKSKKNTLLAEKKKAFLTKSYDLAHNLTPNRITAVIFKLLHVAVRFC